jgi:hypothetical protein
MQSTSSRAAVQNLALRTMSKKMSERECVGWRARRTASTANVCELTIRNGEAALEELALIEAALPSTTKREMMYQNSLGERHRIVICAAKKEYARGRGGSPRGGSESDAQQRNARRSDADQQQRWLSSTVVQVMDTKE